jgi:hypothetical protein
MSQENFTQIPQDPAYYTVVLPAGEFDISNVWVGPDLSEGTITHFVIFGERCSGNHFLKFAMLRNFAISISDASTHFFSEKSLHGLDLDRTLFISLVRHPLTWIDSFFKRLHHVPPHNKISVKAFIQNEFYSIFEEGPLAHSEILDDRHLLTGKRYRNIFELRYTKLHWMLFSLPSLVKHHILLPYELLRDHYLLTLRFIQRKFKLITLSSSFSLTSQYKGSYNYPFLIKPFAINPSIQSLILSSLSFSYELAIGYLV